VAKSFVHKDATLTERTEPGLPDLDLNRGQFQQVILHLLLNAQEAIGRGGRVEVRAVRAGQRVQIEVDDDGPGIAPGDEMRIFDPFFTTKGARAGSEGEGTGLGLTFSLNVVEAHQGTLELVPSRLGGACLRVTLPVPAGTERRSAAPPAAAPRPRARRRLVMVEDDVTIREVVGELLGDSQLSCFSTGPEAVEHCQGAEVDAVLLDINLQGPWDGWKVLEELGTLATPPPVIVTTGSIEAPEDFTYPRIELLRKPYRLAELEAALERATAAPSPAG
jgi:CheY-like chemotaxis protein